MATRSTKAVLPIWKEPLHRLIAKLGFREKLSDYRPPQPLLSFLTYLPLLPSLPFPSSPVAKHHVLFNLRQEYSPFANTLPLFTTIHLPRIRNRIRLRNLVICNMCVYTIFDEKENYDTMLTPKRRANVFKLSHKIIQNKTRIWLLARH